MGGDADARQSLDLSGTWQLVFDPDDEGIAAGWMVGKWPEGREDRVQVPAIWNVTHPEATGVGFYRRVFTIPVGWADRVLQLKVEGSSYRTEAWLNGQYVGSHEGAYTPFVFDVTAAAHVGAENELVMRIAALSKARPVDGMVLEQHPASKQSWYYGYGGLWGDVSLEARPLVSCQAVRIVPHYVGEVVTVEVETSNARPEVRQAELHLEIAAGDGEHVLTRTMKAHIPPGAARFAYRLDMPRPRAWSCADPHLYRLRTEIRDQGELVDETDTRFGMRDFTVRDGEFFLNGEPIFLRGVLLQPNYPVSLVKPPSREMMVREISLMKEAGFNLIRAHLRPAPSGFLDLTDEAGMLVYAETSLAWIKESPRLLDHGRRELEAMIERDRNHPSVAIWGIHNENRVANALTGSALVGLAKSLDPTRVVIDNSGGSMAIDQDFGWIDQATATGDRQTAPQQIQDVHLYLGAPITDGVYGWLRTLGTPTPPIVLSANQLGSPAIDAAWALALRSYHGKIYVSELGCGGMADLDDVVAGYEGQHHLPDAKEMVAFRDSLHAGFEARGLGRVVGTVREMTAATQRLQAMGNTRQLEALLSNPRISGYGLCQLNDVSGEFHAGILDHWRRPKLAYHAAKRLNQPHCIVLKAASPVTDLGGRVEVALTVVSHVPRQGDEDICVTVFDPRGGPICSERHLASAGAHIQQLGPISFTTEEGAGSYRVEARLVRMGEELASSTEDVLALRSPDWATVPGDIIWLGKRPPGLQENRSGAAPPGAGEAQLLVVARPESLGKEDWDDLLAAVDAGGVGVIGPLHPDHELAVRALADQGVKVDLHFGIGNWMGCYHWIPKSELFDGLPAGGLGGEAYVDVQPHYVMSELGGEVLAGSFRNTQTRHATPAMLWYSDIEMLSFGSGRLIFCQYRVFERAMSDPLAGTLLSNLLRLGKGTGGPALARMDDRGRLPEERQIQEGR